MHCILESTLVRILLFLELTLQQVKWEMACHCIRRVHTPVRGELSAIGEIVLHGTKRVMYWM